MVPAARVGTRSEPLRLRSVPLRTYFSIRNKLLWAEKNVSRREWWRILRGALHRLYPRFVIDKGTAGSIHKALLWAVNGFGREWSRNLHDPQEIAHRRGVVDYVFRRFGDCPPRIRAITRVWSSAQNATADSGAAPPERARGLSPPSQPGRESASP